MDAAQFQQTVLQELKNLNQGQQQLLKGQEQLATRLDAAEVAQQRSEIHMDAVEKAQQQLAIRMEGVEKAQQRLETRMSAVETRMEGVEKAQQRLETKVENEVIDKIRVLYDAWQLQQDINARILAALERVETKVDALALETAHVRRVK